MAPRTLLAAESNTLSTEGLNSADKLMSTGTSSAIRRTVRTVFILRTKNKKRGGANHDGDVAMSLVG